MYKDIFCWNIRGFNKYSHHSGFKKWFRLNHHIFGSLIETHVQEPKEEKFIKALLPDWHFEDNYAFSNLGKIWVLWHPSVSVSIISKSLQMITNDHPQVISFFYASNCEIMRRSRWNEINSLFADHRVLGKPWSILGDFNQVLQPSEHSMADPYTVDRGTKEFQACLLNASLADLTFRGSTHTWWNSQDDNPLTEKLDRVLVNDDRIICFPTSLGYFGEPDFSDHSLSCIILNPAVQKQKKPFKFLNFLLKNPDFMPLVDHYWSSLIIQGSSMYRV